MSPYLSHPHYLVDSGIPIKNKRQEPFLVFLKKKKKMFEVIKIEGKKHFIRIYSGLSFDDIQ